MYSRKLDGKVLTLGASGWTYANTFVLYDHQTESIWYPIDDALVGIGGQYAGRSLEQVPMSQQSWKSWKAAHPTSKFLKYP